MPDPRNPLGVHYPAFIPHQRRNPATPVATLLLGRPDNRRSHRLFLGWRRGQLALGRAVLANDPEGTPLRYAQCLLHMIDGQPTPRRTRYFPSTISFRIRASSVRSDTAFLRRWWRAPKTRQTTCPFLFRSGVPERIRTSGPQIRNLMLYPAELRGPAAINSSAGFPIN